MTEADIRKVEHLIASGAFAEALRLLHETVSHIHGSSAADEVIVCKNLLNTLENVFRLGTISFGKYLKHRVRLSNRILALAHQMMDDQNPGRKI